MEIDIIFKIGGIGIVVTGLNQILARSDKSEYIMITTLAGIIIVLTVVVKEKVELKTYLICGGIVLFTMAVILIAAFIDRGKEKRKS